MALVRMTLGGYRCFAQPQSVELRPVTVVLGRNNSGKSALVRAPVVFNTGIRTDSPAALDLDMLDQFGGEILESFTDLMYGNRPHGSLDIELEVSDGGGPLTLTATVQNIDEYRTQVVSSVKLQTSHGETRFDWVPHDPPSPTVYSVHIGGQSLGDVHAQFSGLLPTHIAEISQEQSGKISADSSRFRYGYPEIRYFGPFRDRPRREYRLPSRTPTEVGITGENAAGMLASDYVRGQGKLLQQVNQDLLDNLPGWSLDVVERGLGIAVMLTSHEDSTLRVNLADAGTGVAQVLPIFVQRAADLIRRPPRPVLEIIEQPELHLHPAAHGALADLYLTAVKRSNVRFLIETHSETLLLRLRRRIAEGLDPDTVAIYFVEHRGSAATVRRIKVDGDGNLDYWPEGVFSEDYEEARALATAQLDKRDTDAR
jgi:AAA ATPase domain/Protein of unknown function (DUF3696)